MNDEPKPENQDPSKKLHCDTCGFKGTEVCKEVQKTPVCEQYKPLYEQPPKLYEKQGEQK